MVMQSANRTCATAAGPMLRSIRSSTSSMTSQSRWLTTPGRRGNRVSLIPCLNHPALSRHGRPCQPAFSWGVMIGSFQPSSNGGWRASVLESRPTRYLADIWSRSVNRREYRYDSLLTLRRGTPTNKRFSDTERSEAQTRWNVYADGYWHSLAAEPASRFRAEFSSRPHIRSVTHGLY